MKKVIKLTERDLMNIVKRIIKEQSSSLESKLRDSGYVDDIKSGNKKILVKKIPGAGEFVFELKNGGANISVRNPSNKTIVNLKLKKIGDKFIKGFKIDVEAERLSNYIDKVIDIKQNKPIVTTSSPMDEDRLDFEKMSDEELHDLHPDIKKHPRHFKDYSPTSEYLGWKGEAAKRDIYKRDGKFHNAFDKEK